MLPAGLHAAAFLIALCVQSIGTPLAGAWLPFHLAGCAVLLARGDFSKRKDLVWWATLAWLLALVASAFFIRPVPNGAVYFWFLSAMPMLALCLQQKDLKFYVTAFGGCILLYAIGLLLQWGLNVHYSGFEYRFSADSRPYLAWPLLDPNNAAAVLNIALIPCVWLATHRLRWSIAVAILVAALIVTGSKAGGLAATVSCSLLLAYRYYLPLRSIGWMLVIAVVMLSPVAHYLLAPFQASYEARIPIWKAAASLLTISPWRGIGLGQFANYYAHVRTETQTAGVFAHNDLLQLAIEMGMPVIVFCGLLFAIAWRTTRENAVATCVILAVFIQAMVEFQFYLPCISLALGVALAYHINNKKGTA